MNDELTLLNPDGERAARVLSRCRHVLERRARPRVSMGVIVERAVVSGFALVYVGAMLGIILSLPAMR